MTTLSRFIVPALCASALLSSAVQAQDRTLRVLNWFDYITPPAI